jgi:hypothetical protein
VSPALDLLSLNVIVPAFYVSAGIAFFMGVVAAVLGSIGRRVPLYLAFSLVCFPAAGFIYFSGYYHGSASLAEAAWALRWQSACGFLTVPPFVWFIALYGGQARYGKWLVAVTALFFALAIMSLGSPYSLRFSAVAVDEPLYLPWGERISLVSSTPDIVWQILLRGAIFSVWFWALWRCVVVFRSRRRRLAAFLGACVLLQIGSMVQGALVDFGYLQLFYTAGFAFLALVVLMGVSMALDLRDQKFMLEITLAGLRQEIDRRTRADDRIHRLAYYDPVTGLPNRAWLHERLQERLAQSRDSGLCGALILLHLDRFQIINASIGHAVGNELLRSVSRRPRSASRSLSTIWESATHRSPISSDCLWIRSRSTNSSSRPWTRRAMCRWHAYWSISAARCESMSLPRASRRKASWPCCAPSDAGCSKGFCSARPWAKRRFWPCWQATPSHSLILDTANDAPVSYAVLPFAASETQERPLRQTAPIHPPRGARCAAGTRSTESP